MELKSLWVKKDENSFGIKIDLPCNLGGVNLQLYDWIRKTRLFKTFLLDKPGLKPKDYLLVLGLRNDGDKCNYAIKLISKIWDSNPGLGPTPPLDNISDLQESGLFYSEYRDHVRHSFLVLLLGFFLYESNGTVRKRLSNFNNNGKDHAAFFWRWFVTAVYHDIGYVAENIAADGSNNSQENLKKELLKKCNALIRLPISKVHIFKEKLGDKAEANRSKKIGIEAFCFPEFNFICNEETEKDLLSDFDSVAEKTKIGEIDKTQSILKRYFDLASTTDPNIDEYKKKKRKSFLDHGIVSASLLLRIHKNYIERMEQAKGQRIVRGTDPLKTVKKVVGQKKKLLSIVSDAACAVAFHNINILWDQTNTDQKSLFPENEIDIKFEDDTALIFYLRYIDTLQDWDRPLYRRRKLDDVYSSLTDIDIALIVEDDTVSFGFRPDMTWTSQPDKVAKSTFSECKKEFEKALDKETIASLFTPIKKAGLKKLFLGAEQNSKKNSKKKASKGKSAHDIVSEKDKLQKFKALLGNEITRTDIIEELNLHQCKSGSDKECVYHCQTILFTAEFYRNLQALEETTNFMKSMEGLLSEYSELQNLIANKKYGNISSKFDEIKQVHIRAIIDFFTGLKREGYSDNWTDVYKKDPIALFKERASHFIKLRYGEKDEETVHDFIDLILELDGIEAKPILPGKKECIELGNKIVGPLRRLENIWDLKLFGRLDYIRASRYEVIERLDKYRDRLKSLTLTDFTGSEEFPFPHFEDQERRRIWKKNP